MTRTLTATEVARNFRAVLDELERSGERVRIERHGHIVAELSPARRQPTLGELVEYLRGVECPDADFTPDAEEAHRIMNEPIRNRWES